METRKGGKFVRILCDGLLYGVMGLYFLILFLLLFGKRPVGTFQSVNLIPFHEIGAYLFGGDIARRAFGLGNILGNIVIFIPLGLYVSFLHRKGKLLSNTAVVAAVSTAAEVAQYLFRVGAADIDDVILNTLGGFLGALLFYALNRWFKGGAKTAITFLAPAGGLLIFAMLILGGNLRF